MLASCCVSWTPSRLLCRIGLVEASSGRPQDRAVLELIADTVDRRVDLAAEYAAAEDTTRRVKLSAELRLLEGSLARLLRMVSTDVPAPESQKARGTRTDRPARRWRPGSSPDDEVRGPCRRVRCNPLSCNVFRR